METVWKINDDLSIAGLVSLPELQQLTKNGFQSVLNLRSMQAALLKNEQQTVHQLGLRYVHLPIDSEVMNTELATMVLQCLDELPKPTLVYCNNAILAAAIVLMYIAMQQGEPLQQAFQRAERLGLFNANRNQNLAQQEMETKMEFEKAIS